MQNAKKKDEAKTAKVKTSKKPALPPEVAGLMDSCVLEDIYREGSQSPEAEEDSGLGRERRGVRVTEAASTSRLSRRQKKSSAKPRVCLKI